MIIIKSPSSSHESHETTKQIKPKHLGPCTIKVVEGRCLVCSHTHSSMMRSIASPGHVPSRWQEYLLNLCMFKFSPHDSIKPNKPIHTTKWILNITGITRLNWCFPPPHLAVPLVLHFPLQMIEDEQPVDSQIQSLGPCTWRAGCSTW